ncbi:hypothetical protein [Azospirillum sp. sgz301742]
MRDEYEFLLALSNEADAEVRLQIQRICEMPRNEKLWTQPEASQNRTLPRRPETSRHASH